MSNFNFAESYRASGLVADAETIKIRQQPFNEIKTLPSSVRRDVDLARLYFGLPVADLDWFRSPFAASDPTFTITGNANEVSALAACILEASESELGAMSALALAAFGLHQPAVRPELLSKFRRLNAELSIEWRTLKATLPEKIRPPTKDDASALIDSAKASQSIVDVIEAMRKLNSDSQSAGRQLAESTKVFASSLVGQMDVMQEQLAMLWWHVGGWSKVANKPFSDLKTGAAAILAGIDMCNLSRTWSGPVAAPAILHRTIWQQRTSDKGPLSLAVAVNSLELPDLQAIEISEVVRGYSEVLPVHAALRSAQDLDGNVAWQAAFQKATGLSADVEITATSLAEQVCREASLLSALAGEKS